MAELDLYKAIAHLRSHALPGSIRRCATYVKQALAAGGLPYIGGDGNTVGPKYEVYGYKRVNLKQNGRNFEGMKAGDICSIDVKHHNQGHACMYDGYQWISDFKQRTCIPYNLNTVNWARVWRWKDIPGDFNIPPDENSPMGAGAGGQTGATAGSVGQVVFVKNQYPTHSEYVTYSGNGGNIFSKSKDNKLNFTQAAFTDDSKLNPDNDKFKHKRTRIYSTNDSCIVLDPLHLPLDNERDTFANKGITDKDVKKRQETMKAEEEAMKKKAEEEKKKKEEEEKKKAENTNNPDKSKDKDSDKSKDKSSKDKTTPKK